MSCLPSPPNVRFDASGGQDLPKWSLGVPLDRLAYSTVSHFKPASRA
jgi:hypothetical protein